MKAHLLCICSSRFSSGRWWEIATAEILETHSAHLNRQWWSEWINDLIQYTYIQHSSCWLQEGVCQLYWSTSALTCRIMLNCCQSETMTDNVSLCRDVLSLFVSHTAKGQKQREADREKLDYCWLYFLAAYRFSCSQHLTAFLPLSQPSLWVRNRRAAWAV